MKKIAYVPMSDDFSAPGDRRRAYGYLKKKLINFEKYNKNESYDYIIISQNADLSYWANFRKENTKLIFDFCDAYLFEKLSIRKIFRGLGKFITKQNINLNLNYEKLIKKVCANSDYIICTTEIQKQKLLNYCKNVKIILDMQEEEIVHNNYLSTKKDLNKLNLFWEGQAGNISSFANILSLLNEFLEKDLINLFFVTDKKIKIFSGINLYSDTDKKLKKLFNNSENVFLYEWSNENLSKVASKCDIGLIPVIDPVNGMYANKPANKLHLMWRLGLPVIASSTPAIKLSNEVSGINLLCYEKNDWIKFINFFLNNKNDIKILGKQLKEIANSKFSDTSELNKWNSIFKDI